MNRCFKAISTADNNDLSVYLNLKCNCSIIREEIAHFNYTKIKMLGIKMEG